MRSTLIAAYLIVTAQSQLIDFISNLYLTSPQKKNTPLSPTNSILQHILGSDRNHAHQATASHCAPKCLPHETCTQTQVTKSNVFGSWTEDVFVCVPRSDIEEATATHDSTSTSELSQLSDSSIPISLAFAISANRRLSTFQTILVNSGLSINLSQPGQYTVFAPTNDAFNQLEPWELSKVQSITTVTHLVRNHIVQNHVFHSSAQLLTSSPITTAHSNSQVAFKRASNGQIQIATPKSTDTCTVAEATDYASIFNGKLFIIDCVLIPESLRVDESSRTSTSTTTQHNPIRTTTTTNYFDDFFGGRTYENDQATAYPSLYDALRDQKLTENTMQLCDASGMSQILQAYRANEGPEEIHQKSPHGATFLAPLDVAWAGLGTGVFEALVTSPEDRAFALDVLGYHILADKMTVGDILNKCGTIIPDRLNQQSFEVDTWYGRPVKITCSGDDEENKVIHINKSTPRDSAVIRKRDQIAPDGVLHVIDKILSPPAPIGSIDDILSRRGDCMQFQSLTRKAGLVRVLNDTEYISEYSQGMYSNITVFAFTDEAFEALPSDFRAHALLEPQGLGKRLVLNHIVGSVDGERGLMYMESLLSETQFSISLPQTVPYLLNPNSALEIASAFYLNDYDDEVGLVVNNQTLYSGSYDLRANNGVVHIISTVLTNNMMMISTDTGDGKDDRGDTVYAQSSLISRHGGSTTSTSTFGQIYNLHKLVNHLNT